MLVYHKNKLIKKKKKKMTIAHYYFFKSIFYSVRMMNKREREYEGGE